MSKTNNKYGVKPEVLKQIKYTKRDKLLIKNEGVPHNDTFIQGIVATPPEEWNEGQLQKAKKLKLNEMDAEQIRYWFDNEVGGF